MGLASEFLTSTLSPDSESADSDAENLLDAEDTVYGSGSSNAAELS